MRDPVEDTMNPRKLIDRELNMLGIISMRRMDPARLVTFGHVLEILNSEESFQSSIDTMCQLSRSFKSISLLDTYRIIGNFVL